MNRKYQKNLKFCQLVLVEKYGEEKSMLIIAQAKEIYLGLQKDIPYFQSKANQKLFDMTFFVYPIYKALLSFTSKAEALPIVKQCSIKALDGEFSSSWLLRTLHRSPFLIRLLRKWIIGNVNRANETAGWGYDKYLVGPSILYEFKITQCGIHRLFSKLGAPELVPVICELDHYILKFYPKGVELERAKTIAEGANYCQFSFTCAAKSKTDNKQEVK